MAKDYADTPRANGRASSRAPAPAFERLGFNRIAGHQPLSLASRHTTAAEAGSLAQRLPVAAELLVKERLEHTVVLQKLFGRPAFLHGAIGQHVDLIGAQNRG